MRGFFSIIKTVAFTQMKQPQKFRVQLRLANQQLSTSFRMCSTLATLKMANIFGAFATTVPEEGEENDIETTISRILSVTLKSNTVAKDY